jgi:hypothetical protein
MRRRIVRSINLILALTCIGLVILALGPSPILAQIIGLWINRPPDPTPPPPTITAPRGDMPTGNVGLRQWAQSGDEAYRPIGSGFLLRLTDGTIVGVTTAHAVGDVGDPLNQLEKIGLANPGVEGFVVESDVLYGVPGVPRTGDDLTVDYLLLKVDQEIEPGLVVQPDLRGVPQLGERVSLFSGLGDGFGGRRIIEGTVQVVSAVGFWVLMDPVEYPGGLSGSPLLSNYTGQVVGMAIAVQPRGDRYLIGFNPIGAIMAKTLAANTFPTIDDYTR